MDGFSHRAFVGVEGSSLGERRPAASAVSAEVSGAEYQRQIGGKGVPAFGTDRSFEGADIVPASTTEKRDRIVGEGLGTGRAIHGKECVEGLAPPSQKHALPAERSGGCVGFERHREFRTMDDTPLAIGTAGRTTLLKKIWKFCQGCGKSVADLCPVECPLAFSMVRLHQISKNYVRGGAETPALKGVSLHIPKGQFCAVMGPSGCGKSTLLNLVAGLDTPSSGDLFLLGRSVTGFSDSEWTRTRREVIGMVFQSFHLLPGLTAEENVALPLWLRGEAGGSLRRRVHECLEVVQMSHRTTYRPGELSGGEQQRVAIARALVHRPPLILADEPTGNLDSSQGAHVINLLRKLQQEFGHTVLLVTHSHAAGEEAERIVVMKDGQLDSVPEIHAQ